MKRFASILLAALILSACASDNRNEILKVYNWSCYIDEDLIDEFEDWYEQQTGEKVEVIYQTFDINETMLAKIEMGHEDYDLICPSDYIIERMLSNDLLIPIERNFGSTPDYTQNISPFMKELFKQVEGNGKDANDYSVGYMWGTVGLLYNPKFVNPEETKSWDVLKNPAYAGKIMLKDAFRDVYSSLLVSLNKERIDSSEIRLEDITKDASDESIARIESYLMSFRDAVAGWEADFGKEELCKERIWLSLNWSGDAQWAIDEAAESGITLDYSIPETGSCIWFDGWCIPKYAKNIKAASYFINFMCKPENAVRNMDEIGYVSVVGGPEVLAAQTDTSAYSPVDASYFFGDSAKNACISYVQYPDKSIISRCSMMHDNADRTEALLKMWSRIKGDNATNWTYILIIASVVCGITITIVSRKSKKHGKKRKSSKK